MKQSRLRETRSNSGRHDRSLDGLTSAAPVIFLHQAVTSRQRQGGAVLFVALIFLVLLTLLALTASSTSILQERMTGGMRNRQLALMGSETAVRGGEAFLGTLSNQMTGSNSLPPCEGSSTQCVYQVKRGLLDGKVQAFRTAHGDTDSSSDGARSFTATLSGLTGDLQTASLATQPRFMVEELGLDVPPSSGRTAGAVYSQLGKGSSANRFYRITGRSNGGSAATARAAESVYSAADFRNVGYTPGTSP